MRIDIVITNAGKIVQTLDSAYKEFENDAGRKIQEPIPQLKAVHKKIGVLLSRIELPPYLHSGRKKHSTLTNAKAHKQATVTCPHD
ncbi:hypothetical protein EKTHUN627_18790 [Enterobacter kobei]|uniref:hypothetical protein n=1 Tax=Enterobacter kobei TaxID=208224 RepID=UPI001A272178|nr:hypothetical protein EKTHUN627_18790 [Enterobacter kobei]